MFHVYVAVYKYIIILIVFLIEIENAAAIILLTILLKEKRGKQDGFIKIVTVISFVYVKKKYYIRTVIG